MKKNFDKIYFLDTNIILDGLENVKHLSDSGKNLIVLSEVVIDELDSKKSGFESINYEARKFNSWLNEFTVVKHSEVLPEPDENGDIPDNWIEINAVIIEKGEIEIHIVALSDYKTNEHNTDKSIINDRKIIETAQALQDSYGEIIVVSNDIAMRTYSITRGLKVMPLIKDAFDTGNLEFVVERETDFHWKDVMEIDYVEEHLGEKIPFEKSGFVFTDKTTGNKWIGFRSNGHIEKIKESPELKLPWGQPKNLEQKLLVNLMIDGSNDCIVVDSPAGSGKTYNALNVACHLLDKHRDKYQQIIYIRKTVIAGDRFNDLGFLKGDLDQKLGVYHDALHGTIEDFVRTKYKASDKTEEEIQEQIEIFHKKYPIRTPHEGYMRGVTFKNAVVIIDEIQNSSVADLQLTLSRVGDDCKVFAFGSTRQIDNPYLSKNRNGLSFLMKETTKVDNIVNIKGMKLTKVLRGKISEWADNFKEN